MDSNKIGKEGENAPQKLEALFLITARKQQKRELWSYPAGTFLPPVSVQENRFHWKMSRSGPESNHNVTKDNRSMPQTDKHCNQLIQKKLKDIKNMTKAMK